MARDLPTIPDYKLKFYRDKLWREVNNLFVWENMPEEIPLDYLENILVREGRALFLYDEMGYGYMALKTMVEGYNIYNQPTKARCTVPNDEGKKQDYNRTIVHKYDDEITEDKAGVLINNMYNGEPLFEIVNHYAYRLSLVQNAFDTNAVWQNKPVTWSVDDNTIKLSIEKWFDSIFTGKPLVIMDKTLMGGENEVIGNVTDVPYLLDKLMDAKREIYNEFKETIGLNSPGPDKKERLIVAEVTSNDEIKSTCLEIMLGQRKIACDEINKVFGLNVSVEFLPDLELNKEDGDYGLSNDRTPELTQDE